MNAATLRDILEAGEGYSSPGPVGTGTTLISPSGLTKTLAADIARRLELKPVVTEVGAVLARALGQQLCAAAFRPADYALERRIPYELVERLIESLAAMPPEFFDSFSDALKIQG